MTDRPEKVYCGGIEYIRADIHKDLLSKRAARIKELEAQLEWQPIETAYSKVKPLKGAIVYVNGYILSASLIGSDWMRAGEPLHPTHWMPLPDPPKENE